MVSAEWDEEESKELLRHIVDHWIVVRGFSFVSGWLEKYKQRNKKHIQKAKGVRKQLCSAKGSTKDTSSEDQVVPQRCLSTPSNMARIPLPATTAGSKTHIIVVLPQTACTYGQSEIVLGPVRVLERLSTVLSICEVADVHGIKKLVKHQYELGRLLSIRTTHQLQSLANRFTKHLQVENKTQIAEFKFMLYLCSKTHLSG